MKELRFIILGISLAYLATACVTDPEVMSNEPEMPTLSVEEADITRVSLVAQGSFGSNMADVTEYFVEISETLFENGGTPRSVVPELQTDNSFIANITGLSPNKTYYLRAFITNGYSRLYSPIVTCKTPETSIASVSDVMLKDNFYLTATIEDNGGREVADVGFVWGDDASPKAIRREKRNPGTLSEDGKTITLPLSVLGPGTHYVLAYVEDDKSGTAFSAIPFEQVLRDDDAVEIEDSNFKKYLLAFHDNNEDGKISYAELRSITGIVVSTDDIASVREVESMPDLSSLKVMGTSAQSGKLTGLPIRSISKLATLDCSNNRISALDLSANLALKELNCLGNPLEELLLSVKQEFDVFLIPQGVSVVYVDGEAPAVVDQVNAIDLGLSVKWGDRNMGAGAPEEYGDYYAWGEIETKDEYALGNYKWCDGVDYPNTQYYKYNSDSRFGVVDNKWELDEEDDVAHVKLGDKWRIPRILEINELMSTKENDNYGWEWTSVNGYKGWKITYHVNGNSIFLPAAGWHSYGNEQSPDMDGYYWSSNLSVSSTERPELAKVMHYRLDDFYSTYSNRDAYRFFGLRVRPVDGDKVIDNIPVTGVSLNNDNLVLAEGDEYLLTASISPYHASNTAVVWSSDHPEIASVTNYGSVSALAAGNATITVTTEDGGFTATCGITVEPSTPAPSKFLTFTSEGATTVFLTHTGGNAPVLYFSEDAEYWIPWKKDTITFYSGHPLYVCGDNPEGLSISTSQYTAIGSSGDPFAVTGDVMSLLDMNKDLLSFPNESTLNCLFYGCTTLTSGPSLPATTLSYGCYGSMFEGCTSLNTAPVLPATTLVTSCYERMFMGCTNLITAPELPAKTLASSCYREMFSGCTNLASAPELPATVVEGYSYYKMFLDCSNLVWAPDIPATSVGTNSCFDMFRNCSSLKAAPALPATTLGSQCYQYMFYGCSSMTTAPALPATSLADLCYYYMFADCSSLTAAPELPATTLQTMCYLGMFSGCSSIITAPELPAKILAGKCYSSMFFGCSSLTWVKCLATDISADGCINNWLYGVSSTGTFVKDASVDWPSGASGIPEGWTVEDEGSQVPVAGAVDLGLSVLWATCNIGANVPEEHGDYYAWGEIKVKPEYSWNTYNWCNNASSQSLTKYNYDAEYGIVDNLATLEDADDVAHHLLGDKWRIPTYPEFDELINNCTWTWTQIGGVNGYQIASKVNANSIFLPVTGFSNNYDTDAGFYWTSYLSSAVPDLGTQLIIEQSDISLTTVFAFRDYGMAVRPVYGDRAVIPVTGFEIIEGSLELKKGWTRYLGCSMEPFHATEREVEFSSSNPSVATVSDFLVTAVSPGTSTITITTVDGAYSDSCLITVTD